MDTLIKKISSVPLSDKDLLELNDNDIKIIKYGDLQNYTDIDEVFKDNDKVIVLYEFDENWGHWCCLLKYGNNVEFFDPLGKFIDDSLDVIDDKFKKKSGQDGYHLSKLLIDSPYNLKCNNYPFQKNNKDIASCGRHCALRCILSDIDLDKYIKLFKESKMNPDMIASYLTAYI